MTPRACVLVREPHRKYHIFIHFQYHPALLGNIQKISSYHSYLSSSSLQRWSSCISIFATFPQRRQIGPSPLSQTLFQTFIKIIKMAPWLRHLTAGLAGTESFRRGHRPVDSRKIESNTTVPTVNMGDVDRNSSLANVSPLLNFTDIDTYWSRYTPFEDDEADEDGDKGGVSAEVAEWEAKLTSRRLTFHILICGFIGLLLISVTILPVVMMFADFQEEKMLRREGENDGIINRPGGPEKPGGGRPDLHPPPLTSAPEWVDEAKEKLFNG
jgi:hypothetical protein